MCKLCDDDAKYGHLGDEMTADNPTIDEQMCVYSSCNFPRQPCIGNCKRITESAGRPEPVANIIKAVHEQGCKNGCGSMKNCICSYAEDLADHVEKLETYADRVAAERDAAVNGHEFATRAHEHEMQRAETAERQLAERCDHCGAKVYSGPPDCPTCGAPNCCPQCCRIDTLTRQLAELSDLNKSHAFNAKHFKSEYEKVSSQLAELQEKTQHLVEPQNPCNCVSDGDDGTVVHLCHWHKTTLGKAYRMQNMADTLTVENIAKLPMDKLRLWIAHGIQESTARKRAEEQLAELQRKHDALVAKVKEWHDFWEHYSSLSEGYQDDLNDERHATISAMSAVALREGDE